MDYSVITGEQFDINFLKKLYDIDKECYSDEFVGDLSKMEARFMQNNKTFICLMAGNNPVGYINFFPVTVKLWEEIVEEGMNIRDDDIIPDELCDYCTDSGNYLFILSVVILPEHRMNKEAVSTLTYGFIDYLCNLQTMGYSIKAISATTISDDGEKYISSLLFGFYREIHEGHKVWVIDGLFLKKLLNRDLYFMSYKCDVYIELTFDGHLDNLNSVYSSDEYIKIISELNSGRKSGIYVYAGKFGLRRNRYIDEDNGVALKCDKNTACEEDTYLFLSSGEDSTAKALLVIPNLKFSPTQLVRQVGEDSINLWSNGDSNILGFHIYSNLIESLHRKKGLRVKNRNVFLCMSNAPKNEEELMDILHGIVYNGEGSARRRYFVRTDNVKSVTVILDEFKDKTLGERVRHMTQYLC